jgi:hypothetical protein
MKNYPYYIYTTIGLLLLFVIISPIATSILSRYQIEHNLDIHIEVAKKESRTIATMSEGITDKTQKEKLKERIQKSITFSENEIIFNSILDWSGKYICYPDKKEIGKIAPENKALKLIDQGDLTGKYLYNSLFKDNISARSEIILLTPVKNSDWIIASHINKNRVIEQAASLKKRLYASFSIITLLTLLFTLGSLRAISRYYEGQLALKNSKLEDGVLNLSKLNTSLENYQKSLSEFTADRTWKNQPLEEEDLAVEETKDSSKNTKKRILTYVRNEILSVSTEDISHIYVDNTITYVVRKDGKRSTTGDSLDLIYSSLDERFFFRVNRQIIVAISAIETITKFGNSKLKIQVKPTSEVDIIIGKNKAAAFKQWLDL